MTDYKSILLYYYKGNTNTQIATICGCSRTTVIKTIKRAKELNLKLPLPATLRDADLYLMLYPIPGLCRRYALKERERSAKAKSAAIFILSTRKRKPIRIESYRL